MSKKSSLIFSLALSCVSTLFIASAPDQRELLYTQTNEANIRLENIDRSRTDYEQRRRERLDRDRREDEERYHRRKKETERNEQRRRNRTNASYAPSGSCIKTLI